MRKQIRLHMLTFGVQGQDRGRVCGGKNLVE